MKIHLNESQAEILRQVLADTHGRALAPLERLILREWHQRVAGKLHYVGSKGLKISLRDSEAYALAALLATLDDLGNMMASIEITALTNQIYPRLPPIAYA